jgi:hypothetical protein
MKQTLKEDDVTEFSVPTHHEMFKQGRPTGQRNRGVQDHNNDEGLDGNITPPPPANLAVRKWGQQQHQFTSNMIGKKQNLIPIIRKDLIPHSVYTLHFAAVIRQLTEKTNQYY